MRDVFGLEVEYHQHVQPYTSAKDGTIKWALLELWPLQVSHIPTLLASFCSNKCVIARRDKGTDTVTVPDPISSRHCWHCFLEVRHT